MSLTFFEGTMSANGFFPAEGISIPFTARLILEGPTFGGGTVHLCVADKNGTYFRTGQNWQGVGAYIIDMQRVEGLVKLELAGSTSPTIAWEVAVKR